MLRRHKLLACFAATAFSLGIAAPAQAQTFTQQGAKLVGSGATGVAEQGYGVSLSADGNTLLVGGPYDSNSKGAGFVFMRSGGAWSGSVKLVGTGYAGTFSQMGRSAALSSDGTRVAIAYLQRAAELWQVAPPRRIAVLADTAHAVLAFSPDGSRLATGSPAGVRVWNATNSDARFVVRGHGSRPP